VGEANRSTDYSDCLEELAPYARRDPVAAGPAGAFSGESDLDTLLGLLGGGYTVGDVFAPTR
jgi:hypothetical protein